MQQDAEVQYYGWFLICSSKANLSASVISLLGISLGSKVLNEKNRCIHYSRLTNAVTARLRAAVPRCSFILRQ
jgi:hypothetical protein